MKRLFFALLLLGGTISFCGREPARRSLILATTTSVHDSGLLDHLAREFKRKTNIEIDPLSVGSGKALQLAAAGHADVIITHDPDREAEFVRTNKPPRYRPFMFNEFVLVGPQENPARIAASDPAVDALRAIARTRSRFCSRGDRSGTHVREMALWREAGIDPTTNPSYTALGQSMGALLRSADEIGCYALSDLPTFAQFSHTLDMVIVNRGDARLRNVYAVTLVRSDEEARRFVDWLLADEGRHAIERFTIDGRQLFFPLGSE